MSTIKFSELPYVGKTGYTGTDIVPFVSYINPSGTTSETKIDDLKDYVLDNSFVQNVIKVGKGGNVNFTSLYDAIQSITASSSTNRYVIEVGPGIYSELPMNLVGKEYVSIVGTDINAVVITPNSTSDTIFQLGNASEISFLTISGATSGIGILCENLDGFSLIHKVSMYDNSTQIRVIADSADTTFYSEYVDLNGSYGTGVYVYASNGFSSQASLENHFNFPFATNTIANHVQGVNASMNFGSGDCVGDGTTGSVAFYIEDSADLTISSSDITNFDIGVQVSANGGGSTFDIDAVSIIGSLTNDLLVQHTGASGTIQGSLSHEKISNVSENVYWGFLDHEDGEFDITRKLSVTFKDGTHTDLSTLIFESGTMGVLEGGVITTVSGLTISISEGYGYIESAINNGVIKRYDWLDIQHTLPVNDNQYIYINQNGVLSNSGSRPTSIYNIILGRVVTNSTDIVFIDNSPLNASHTSNSFGNLFRNALGPIFASGSIVTENVTPYHLNVTSGDYYYSTNEYVPSGGTDITFSMYYRDGGSGWVVSATTEVINGYDDNSGTISPLPLSAFTKHTLYLVGDGIYEQYFLVLGQNQYASLVETEGALLPTPPTYFQDSVTQIASIYIQQGVSDIVQIEDIRPVIGFKAGGVNASSLHANLLGLTADDHKQYLLVDGSRAMEGDINMGSNDIYSAGTISSNVISATTYQNLPNFLPLSGGTLTGSQIIKYDGTGFIVATPDYIPGFSGTIIFFTTNLGNTYSSINSRINGGGANGDLVLQENSGNVGVGKVPAANVKLDVNGRIGATSVSATSVSATSVSTTSISATSVSATTYYNVPSFVNIVFSHSSIGPVDATTYYIGPISTLSPSTANRTAWSLDSQYTGTITDVSIISNFGGGSSENSTMTLYNLSANTSQVITSTLQYVSGTPVQILFESFTAAATIPAGWSSVFTTFTAGANGYAGLTGTTSTLTSPTFDGSAYASLNIQTDVATFGTGTDGPVLIEYSLNNGSTWTSAGTTVTPTSTTYLTSTVSVPSTSTEMKLRFSVNPTGTRGKRLRNVYFNGLSSSINTNFVLGTPLAVTSGDRLQIRWVTPTWVTNPSGVTNIFNLKLKL